MMNIIRYAYRIYMENRSAWNELVSRAMDKNFSWNSSAREYEALYDKLCDQ
jgi:starch synthase